MFLQRVYKGAGARREMRSKELARLLREQLAAEAAAEAAAIARRIARELALQQEASTRVIQRAWRFFRAHRTALIMKRAVEFDRRRGVSVRMIQRAFRRHRVRAKLRRRHEMLHHLTSQVRGGGF